MLAKVGDIVKVYGISAEIAEIYYQDWHGDNGWHIVFVDTDGESRSWKQWFDGGELIQK